jgi:class 3 adenylate cyclase
MNGLATLIDNALAQPEPETWLAGAIERLSEDVAVLIVDMTGFTSRVRDRGLAHALIAIRHVQSVVAHEVNTRNGRVLKFEADNAFCAFFDIEQAEAAAEAIRASVGVCIGIGYGRTLMAGGDYYGAEVNAASRLAEDIGERDQILFTEAALEQRRLRRLSAP